MENYLQRLKESFPSLQFNGGDRSDGYWITVSSESLSFVWQRIRMTSPESAYMAAMEAALGV